MKIGETPFIGLRRALAQAPISMLAKTDARKDALTDDGDPILPHDDVIARTWLGAADGPRFDRFIDIRKPGAARPAAAVKSTWALIDRTTRRPRRVGADILNAFGVAGAARA